MTFTLAFHGLLLGNLINGLLGTLMAFLSLFLILLVLVQRGKGGGLAGALGGAGGQSAFGAKAGDTFTVITIVVASAWGFVCAFAMWKLGTHAPEALTDSAVNSAPGDVKGDDDLIIPDLSNTSPSSTLTPAGGSIGSIGDDASPGSAEDAATEKTTEPAATESAAADSSDADSSEDAAEIAKETATE